MTDNSPPIADRRPAETTRHGETRTDDYAWLKDEDWQSVMKDPNVLDADIRAYLEAENAYTAAWLADTETLQAELFQEMKDRQPEDDDSVPDPDGPKAYFVRFVAGGQHPVFCRRDSDAGEESADESVEILLDGNAEAEGQAFFKIGGCDHSPDHAHLAYAVDVNGSEIFEIAFRRAGEAADLAERIHGASGNLAWAADGRTLYYTVLDENHRPHRVMRHALGSEPSTDTIIYEEPDPGFFVGIGATESRRFIVIDSHDHVTSEVRLIDGHDTGAQPRLIAAREPGVEYTVSDWRDQLLLRTNRDGAEDFKIVTAPLDDAGPGNWRDMVPHRPGTLLLGDQVFAGYLARMERVGALPRIVVRDLQTGEEHTIAFDEEAYALGLQGGYEFDTTRLRFAYSSPTTPERIYDYDMVSRERVLMKEQQVPSGHDPADYVTRRIQATAPDGETVPITLLHHRTTPLDGTAPVLLYGYGSYGYSIPAGFGTPRLSLVDRGFVYAIAHIRGGMEKGYRWYTDGKLEKKTNTFTDFVACAEGLIDQGLARAGHIAMQGGSAGGMLMGAVVNMRPELWRAVIAEVPFVDVLNTMCDTSLPLTPMEWPEWGNPIEDAEAYRRMRNYSPYDNVAARAYPAMLVTGGLTDPRVTYWEPAKWVARLRATKTDDNPLIMKINMEAGHGGAAGRYDRLEEVALNQAFLLKVFENELPTTSSS